MRKQLANALFWIGDKIDDLSRLVFRASMGIDSLACKVRGPLPVAKPLVTESIVAKEFARVLNETTVFTEGWIKKIDEEMRKDNAGLIEDSKQTIKIRRPVHLYPKTDQKRADEIAEMLAKGAN